MFAIARCKPDADRRRIGQIEVSMLVGDWLAA
jgi:hypothetical protein